MSNLVIVAIPDENDRTWKVSSEKVPHLTLLFLGDIDQVPNPNSIVDFVEHAASTTLKRFYLTVDRRGELGDDKADVLFFKKGYDYKAIRDFRAALLQDHNIRKAYDSAEQREGPWIPHLTLGYPATPAKPEADHWGGFYSVDFNKISVWVDDYDGPEFFLKDYWDEYEAREAVPMDVAMSSLNQVRVGAGMEALEHFGVKGMRWGVRNATPSVVERPRSVLTTNQRIAVGGFGAFTLVNKSIREGVKEDNRRAKDFKADKKWEKDFQKAKSFKFDDQKHTEAYNKKWKDHDFSKEDWDNPSPKYKEYVDGYFKSMNTEYAKQFAEHYGESPSGKYEAHHEPGTDLVKLRKTGSAQHALEDGVLVTFRITRDANGLITGLEQVEDLVAQTVELGVAFLEHYGVKGMRWGVRNEKETRKSMFDPEGHDKTTDIFKVVVWNLVPPLHLFAIPADIRVARAAGRGAKAKAIDLNEQHFQRTASAHKNFVKIHNGAVNQMNRDLDPINAKYPNPSKDAKTQKKYDNEVLASMQKAYRDSANSIGNRSNTMHLDVDFKNDGLDFTIHAREGQPKAKVHQVSHSAVAVDDEGVAFEFTGKIKRDAAGHILGFEFDDSESAAQHTVDLGATLVSTLFDGATLEHYGIKGMRWGVRNQRDATTQSHVDTGLVRRRTQVVAKGGESHPAHDDAIKAAVNRQKLKKSGTDALSNQELRELASRIQLENQVAILTSSKGKRFVQQQLEEQSKQEFKKGAARAAPHVVRKVRRGAAVGAAAAALA